MNVPGATYSGEAIASTNKPIRVQPIFIKKKEKKDMNKFKRIVSLLLAIATLFCITTEAFAANDLTATYSNFDDDKTVYEVVDDRSPIRSGATEDYDVLCYVNSGALLVSSGTVLNYRLHRWMKIDMSDGSTGYIYSNHVREHTHSYCDLTFGEGDDEMIFSVCDCGKTKVRAASMTGLGYAKTIAGSVVGFAGTLGVIAALEQTATSTGILIVGGASASTAPVWPVIAGLGGVLCVAAGISLLRNGLSTTKMKEIDLGKLMKENAGYCYADSIHIVDFNGGTLCNSMKKNTSCVDSAVAFIYGYSGGYLWVRSAETAKEICTLVGGGYNNITVNGYSAYAFLNSNGDPTGGAILYGGTEPLV